MIDPYSVSAEAGAIVEAPWLLEFDQSYDDGMLVEKKAVEATPMVIRKYGIKQNEVMAFSSHERRRRALTVFHFHPNFPEARRRDYMETHIEGHELAADYIDHAASLHQLLWVSCRARARKVARVGGLAVHALAIFVITHIPAAR